MIIDEQLYEIVLMSKAVNIFLFSDLNLAEIEIDK